MANLLSSVRGDLSSLHFYRSCRRIERYDVAREEAFDVAAADHLVGGENMHLGWGDKRNGIAQLEGYIQLVSRKDDAFMLVVRQAAEQRA